MACVYRTRRPTPSKPVTRLSRSYRNRMVRKPERPGWLFTLNVIIAPEGNGRRGRCEAARHRLY